MKQFLLFKTLKYNLILLFKINSVRYFTRNYSIRRSHSFLFRKNTSICLIVCEGQQRSIIVYSCIKHTSCSKQNWTNIRFWWWFVYNFTIHKNCLQHCWEKAFWMFHILRPLVLCNWSKSLRTVLFLYRNILIFS